MPQGFDPNPAFKTKDASLIKTKNTEIRENFDNERSIGGIQDPIRGKSTVHDSFVMSHRRVYVFGTCLVMIMPQICVDGVEITHWVKYKVVN